MTGHGCILANSTLDCDHFGLRRDRRTLKLERIPMNAADPSSGAARVASDIASMRRPRFVGL